jgi:hypothetical protein
MPTPFSSPTMRLYPQCGFSRARRAIRERNDDSSGGPIDRLRFELIVAIRDPITESKGEFFAVRPSRLAIALLAPLRLPPPTYSGHPAEDS